MRREHLNILVDAARILEREGVMAQVRIVTEPDGDLLRGGSVLARTDAASLADAIRNFSQRYVLDDS